MIVYDTYQTTVAYRDITLYVSDVVETNGRVDHMDSWPYVAARIAVNEEFATAPAREASMNARGFDAARHHIALGDSALVLDLGCNNLVPATRGAELANVNPYIVGVDIDDESYRMFPPHKNRTVFIQADAQRLPFADGSFDLTQAHNTIFRVPKPSAMLAEMYRVTKPGGLVAVSTNAPSHGYWRHRFERIVAEQIIDEFDLRVEPPKAPAHGSYLQKIQNMLGAMPGLVPVQTDIQRDYSIITEDRLRTYQFTIETSAAFLPALAPEVRHRWRQIVAEKIVPMIRERMRRHRDQPEPYFADRIHRGLFILKKVEP